MPAPAQFPTPEEFDGVGGPFWTDFHYDGPDYNVFLGPKYEDGSRDRNVVTVAGTHRWTIDYESLTEAEQAILDAHYQSALGAAYAFNFYDHRIGAMFTNCYYESYKRSKGKLRIRGKRKVVIVCEPS